jgi:hypothetical protein
MEAILDYTDLIKKKLYNPNAKSTHHFGKVLYVASHEVYKIELINNTSIFFKKNHDDTTGTTGIIDFTEHFKNLEIKMLNTEDVIKCVAILPWGFNDDSNVYVFSKFIDYYQSNDTRLLYTNNIVYKVDYNDGTSWGISCIGVYPKK